MVATIDQTLGLPLVLQGLQAGGQPLGALGTGGGVLSEQLSGIAPGGTIEPASATQAPGVATPEQLGAPLGSTDLMALLNEGFGARRAEAESALGEATGSGNDRFLRMLFAGLKPCRESVFAGARELVAAGRSAWYADYGLRWRLQVPWKRTRLRRTGQRAWPRLYGREVGESVAGPRVH